MTLHTKQYTGGLTPEQAATAMQAARLNAIDLVESAEILFTLKRFAHSMAFSTLAIEEASKYPLIFMLFLGPESGRSKLWKSYRSHRAKSSFLNPGIESRIRAVMPHIPPEAAKEIGKKGPTPDQLEYNKQRALYSDCLEISGDLVCHLPNRSEWRQLAWDRMCEAQAIVFGLRDYPPAELEVWLKHIRIPVDQSNVATTLTELHKELLDKGFVKKGWWDTLLKDVEREFGSNEADNTDKESAAKAESKPPVANSGPDEP